MRALDDRAIRRYLLGLLPEPEAEALEQAYLGQPEFLERVRGVEHDLLDDYAAGRLDPSEKELFASRYLASPPLRERVVASRALRLATREAIRPPARLFAAAPRTRWLGPTAVAASLLLAVVALWRWPSRAPEVTMASVPPTAVARSETPMPGPDLAPLVFALSPVLLRGEDGPRDLRIPPGTATVVLELEGNPALVPLEASQLDVVIQTVEGASVWRGGARRVNDPERTSLLASISAPARQLAPGDYVVTLSAGDQLVHRYFVRTQAPR